MYNMGMKKDKSSEVYGADDADCDSLRAKNLVCERSHLSASQSDNSTCMNDDVLNSSRSFANNFCYGASNNAFKDVKMLLESNARDMVIEDQISSKLAHSSNENMAYNNHSDAGHRNELISTITNKDCLHSCTESEQMKSSNSAAIISNDLEKVKGAIAQSPPCSLDLQVDAALDAVDPLVGSKARASANDQTGENDTEGQQSTDCLSSRYSNEKAHKYDTPGQFAEIKKHPLISSLESVEDDGDLEEQDVKVCDICGDAGREDLLAICSRCSDGAEHTYCMREMLDEVPEGHWLCEECKSCEEMERKRQGYSEILGVKEGSKKKSDSLLEKKDHSVPGNRADNDSSTKHLTNKRRGSDVAVDPAGKKQILESMVHSPSTSSSVKDGALSRDISFKNVDKMNANLTHQTSISGRDSLEKPQSPNANMSNAATGSYFKSNSFGTSSFVPRVKMVVEIPQKHKQGVDVKDASSKILTKSMPSKGSLSRSNTTESKVKMLSPKDSHILESRGLKQAKDRNVIERKNSIKLDHSSASHLAVNGFKIQHRGEGRRQQSSYTSGGGSSSTNAACSSADVKSSLSLKEGCTSSLSRLDGFNSEKNLDKSSSLLRQRVGDGTLQSSALDTSSVRSLKDGLNEENKLKAAIQAAMQKRLDMCRRSKGPDKSSLVSVSNVDSVDGKATLNRPYGSRNSVSAEGMNEAEAASPCSSLNYVKENNVNRPKVLLDDSLDSFQARNMDSLSSDIEQIRRRSAIPEHEFAWIGSFEVYRDGTTSEHFFGIQAHLSTCASNKVLEMVKKFPQKVPLSEVPRSYTWPVQFQDGGAEEDNIAVYFFAKDVESYERSYKILLEKLMKEDLALKGNIDGIDLLIFPSKQLMKRSQRRKENCLDNKSGYVEKLDLSSLNTNKDVIISLQEKPSLDGYVRENISTNTFDQDISGHSAFDSGVVLAKECPRSSNGDHCLGEHSLHKPNSSVTKKFGHQESRNEIEFTCYPSEATCGRRYKSTLVVEYGNPGSVKIAECQTSQLLSVGGDSSYKVDIVSVDQSPAQEVTSLDGSIESKTVAEVKDEVKFKETVKDEVCEMKLAGTLKTEDMPVDYMNDQGQIKVEDNSRQEIQCSSKEKHKAKVVLDGELKQEAVIKEVDLVGDVKEDVFNQQQLLQRKCPDEACTVSIDCPNTAGQKRPLNGMNVAYDIHRSSNTFMDKRYKVASAETGRFFFPVDVHPSARIKSKDDSCSSSSMVVSESSGNDDDGFPNLELALGVENRTESGFFLGLVDDHRNRSNPLNVGQSVGRKRKEDEESSVALSLSLAFPFGNKERSAASGPEFPEKGPRK
ncbi:hypothetical protein V2J09_013345 [Rumex salicifolius]